MTGFIHPDKVITNSGAKIGDVLFLTKPIGIGILTTGMKAEIVSKESEKLAYSLMTTLNKSARDVMVKYDVHACTDVTGFSLMGHLLEMVQGSDVNAEIHTDDIDLIEEAKSLAKMGVLPEGLYRNRSYAESYVDEGNTELYIQDMLFDPQTAGGLLIAVDETDADRFYEELKTAVPSAQRIGVITPKTDGKRIKLV